MTFDPHVVTLGAITVGAGWLMTISAVRKNALEWRRRRRTCPSCGRELVAGTCPCRST